MKAYGMFFRRLLLRALKHIDDRELTITQLRIVFGLKLGLMDSARGIPLQGIAKNAGLSASEVERLLPELIELRYIHDDVALFGTKTTYRMGSVGGSFTSALRRDLQRYEEEVVDGLEELFANEYAREKFLKG